MRTVRIRTRIAALAAPVVATTVAATAFAVSMATPASASDTHSQAPARGQVWHQVTANGLENFADIGLAVGSHDALNVIWTSGGTSGGHAAVLDTPVSATGAVGRTATVASGGFLYTDPDAIQTSKGIGAVWNGIQTSTGPQGTFIASRDAGGGSWSSPSVVPPLSGIAFTTNADTATTGSDGKPWVAFSSGSSLTVDHVGQAEQELRQPTCCVIDPGLAVDGRTGATWIAYRSIITGHEGVFLQPLHQSGTAAGASQLLPGSRVRRSTLPLVARIAVTARGHGRPGVYVAYVTGYPSGLGIDVLRAGSHTAVKVASTSAAHAFAGVAIAGNSGGGVWVAWSNGDGSAPGLTVRESNSAVTKFGRALRVPLPSGTSVIWKEYISAAGSRLDIVALLTRHGKVAYWFTQVR
jgi:hypothetical protein